MKRWTALAPTSLVTFSTTVLAAALVTFSASSAHALFEIRAGLGLQKANPSELNAGQISSRKIEDLGAINVDAIVMPPLFPVGLGLRYEMLANKAEGGGGTVTASVNRLALLINKRFIDSAIFFGPIGTIGLSSSSSIEYKIPPAATVEYKSDKLTTWSVGAEAGMNLIGFMFGGELGYQNIVAKDYKYGSSTLANASGGSMKADFSGVYARIMVGFGF